MRSEVKTIEMKLAIVFLRKRTESTGMNSRKFLFENINCEYK